MEMPEEYRDKKPEECSFNQNEPDKFDFEGEKAKLKEKINKIISIEYGFDCYDDYAEIVQSLKNQYPNHLNYPISHYFSNSSTTHYEMQELDESEKLKEIEFFKKLIIDIDELLEKYNNIN